MAITYNAYAYVNSNEFISLQQITGTSGGSDIINLVSQDTHAIYKHAVFQILIASINTNVVCRFEGSLDGVNWYNLDEASATETYTANGTYFMEYRGEGCSRFIRFYKVSESGGTDSTIDLKVKVFN